MDVVESETEPLTTTTTASIFKSYDFRWGILAIFCVANFANASFWITFAPIDNLTSDFLGSDSETLINFLALTYLIFYGPGTVIQTYCTDVYGLRQTILIGCGLTFVGSIIRTIGAFIREDFDASPMLTYSFFLIGQILGAIAQPFFLNTFVRICGVWFPMSERDAASTIAIVFNPLGSAVGAMYPPSIVYESGGKVHGMTAMLFTQVAMCFVPFFFCVLFFDEQPPSPPSRSSQQQAFLARASGFVPMSIVDGKTTAMDSWRLIKDDAKHIMSDSTMSTLLVATSLIAGMLMAILINVDDIVGQFGYSNSNSGTFSAVCLIAGVMGTILMGVMLDATHTYNQTFKACAVLSFVVMFVFLLNLRANNYYALASLFALLGFFVIPMGIIGIVCAAEHTYPISEERSSGLVQFWSNLAGIPLTFIAQVLVTSMVAEKWGFIAVVSFAGSLCAVFVSISYKRFSAELAHRDL